MLKKIPMLVAALFFVAAYGASAHSEVVTSIPEADQTVHQAVSDITLTFDTKIEQVIDSTVTDGKGKKIKTTAPVIKKDTVTLHTDTPLDDGTYKVAWTLIGSDGHKVSNNINFTVNKNASDQTIIKDKKTVGKASSVTEKRTETASEREKPVFIVLIVGLIAVIVTALYIILRNKRSK